jgi:hypothetical protein
VNYQELYSKLTIHLRERLPTATVAQVRNQALVTQALAYSPNCHLATLAMLLSVPGQRENLVQRIRRWLANQAVTQQRCYMPLVRQLFAQWCGAEVGLVMDRTDIEDQRSILMLAIGFRHRALPLAWRVLPFGGTNAETQIALLKQVQPYLPDPKQVRITLYGDCEFRAVEVQRYCQAHHWHWQLGLKSDTLFCQGAADWQPLKAIGVTHGQRCYIQDAILTQQHAFGPVNLVADWTSNEETPRYVVTDQHADRNTWRRGRKRFWIEPFFRDWKSYGFDLESSKLVHPHRLETLLLGMATATLWLVHVGQWIIETDRRPLLEACHKRDYSIFRLGRDYAFRSQLLDWPLPVGFTVSYAD